MSNGFSYHSNGTFASGVVPISEGMREQFSGAWVEFEKENSEDDIVILANVNVEDPRQLWARLQPHLLRTFGSRNVLACVESGYLFVFIDKEQFNNGCVDPADTNILHNGHLEPDYLHKRMLIDALFHFRDVWSNALNISDLWVPASPSPS
ncbi:hypothetical protein J3459_005929 [Metarhizium acridum]|nr:hypothetical protein J3459_005929 [Metarhizium acridum]